MKMLRTGAILLAVSILAIFLLYAPGCGGGGAQAEKLVREADGLRISAADRFRKSTAAIDGLVSGAAAGQSLPVNQTKSTAGIATGDLTAALGDLTLRNAKLTDAGNLAVSDSYKHYLDLLRQSNDKLSESVNLALDVSRLLEKEQYSLAGWDEIKTEIIVSQVRTMQDNIQRSYSESETLRNQAEQMKKDNPGEFG